MRTSILNYIYAYLCTFLFYTYTHKSLHVFADEQPFNLVKDGKMFATVQVASVDDSGRLVIPDHVKSIWIDVGTNSAGFLQTQDQSVFILGFEPLQDKWAKMLSAASTPLNKRSSKSGLKRNAVPLGKSRSNSMILPFAISSSIGFADFYVTALDGCSSLKAPKATNDSRYSLHIKTVCAEKAEIRKVPTLSLEYVLGSLLPREIPVTHLKIDAQGHDLAVAKSASTLLKSVHQVTLESYPDDCPPFYDGQPLCSEIVSYMAELGFALWKTRPCTTGAGCGTQNLIFRFGEHAIAT